MQETEAELFPGERIITAGYRTLFHELSDTSCEFDIIYGASESDSTCIVLDNGTYIEYLIYNGAPKMTSVVSMFDISEKRRLTVLIL